jgi:citrate lyase subunit beta/citryl-CoA lyase
MLPTTYLFVPAPEERKVRKALESGAGAVILDLEDAVPEREKQAARIALAPLLAQMTPGGPEVWIRVNGADSHFAADVAAIDWARVTGAVLPKAEDPAQVVALARAGARQVLLLVESARGLHNLEALVSASNRVHRLGIGTWDLALDLGLIAVDDPDESELIWRLRGDVVVESRRLGLPPPVDGVFAGLSDDQALRDACLRAFRLGYGAKLLIHPKQLGVAHDVFRLDADRLALARELVDAYDDAARAGQGAIAVRGQMVDRVMAERARATLRFASEGSNEGGEREP